MSQMVDEGVTFTPKINKKSTVIDRTVDDLFNWETHKNQKNHIMKSLLAMEDTQQHSNMCEGTFKILKH